MADGLAAAGPFRLGSIKESKRRKNFGLGWARGIEMARAEVNKVFLLLFVHKKKRFLLMRGRWRSYGGRLPPSAASRRGRANRSGRWRGRHPRSPWRETRMSARPRPAR